ncbi:MAG TPA: YkvA family protein [Chthoniobacterales bacterium]|nr:YkvA family protein [Chthoniobacterales bacterium]
MRTVHRKKRKPASKPVTSRKAKARAGTPPRVEPVSPIGDEITQSAAYRRAGVDAQAFARDPNRLRRLVEDAVGKISIIPRGPFADTWPYLMAMIRLIRDYQRAEYRDISEVNLLTIIAAILYFVSPFDVIPDWVPVLGHIDDAFVISLALKSVRGDLDTFMAWETARI